MRYNKKNEKGPSAANQRVRGREEPSWIFGRMQQIP